MPKYKECRPAASDQEKRISAEKRRLAKLYEELTGHRKELATKLIDRAANQLVMVEDLEQYLSEHGYTEEYQNGANQTGKKQSSEMQVYISVAKQYNQTIKQLDDMLDGQAPVSQNELIDFMQRRPVVSR